MRISLITLSPQGVDWRTLRKGQVVGGHISPDVPIDGKGRYFFTDPRLHTTGTGYGRPFADLPDFFDATPKFEKAFRALAREEFAVKCLGLVLFRPVIAVHLTGYSRGLHLGEKTYLKDCIVRWGARDVILCNWPTPYTDSEIRDIVTMTIHAAFKRGPGPTLQPRP